MYQISFEDPAFAPIEVGAGANLGEVLDGSHSPVFFGCKAGGCGTCLVELDPHSFALLPPAQDSERKVLDAMAGDKPYARLACQIEAACDMRLRYLSGSG